MSKLVVIESPLAGKVDENIAYAKRCMLDSLRRGEAPYASHLLFPQPGILDDLKPEERRLGIDAGLEWGRRADLVAVYVDLGVSPGMRAGIAHHIKVGMNIEVRAIDRELTPEDAKILIGGGS